jgi:hypothetical protein
MYMLKKYVHFFEKRKKKKYLIHPSLIVSFDPLSGRIFTKHDIIIAESGLDPINLDRSSLSWVIPSVSYLFNSISCYGKLHCISDSIFLY